MSVGYSLPKVTPRPRPRGKKFIFAGSSHLLNAMAIFQNQKMPFVCRDFLATRKTYLEVEAVLLTYDAKGANWIFKRFEDEDRINIEIQTDNTQKTIMKNALIGRVKFNQGIGLSAEIAVVSDNYRLVKGTVFKPEFQKEKVIFS